MSENIPTNYVNSRVFLAAHAPSEPEEWFLDGFIRNYGNPPMSPKGAEYCDGCRGDGDCEHTLACLAAHDHALRVHEWRQSRDKLKLLRWRWAWADAMLGEA